MQVQGVSVEQDKRGGCLVIVRLTDGRFGRGRGADFKVACCQAAGSIFNVSLSPEAVVKAGSHHEFAQAAVEAAKERRDRLSVILTL